MAVRRKKAQKKTRKVAKKAVKKRVKKVKKVATKAVEFNHKAHWKAYKELQARAEKAWVKFRNSVKKNAPSNVLVKEHNHLLLLLGECNYMQRECSKMAAKSKKTKRW